MRSNPAIAAFLLALCATSAFAADCTISLSRLIVCDAANAAILDEMRARHLEAITVMQDVATGSLLVFAASDPAKFDVSTEIVPLSLSKLLLAASWWDHDQPDANIAELISSGSDSAGKQVAVALRNALGNGAVLADLERFGFGKEKAFWGSLDSQWKSRLTPAETHPLDPALNDEEWAAALSIGETHITTTALQLSRFLQAVGNGGLLCMPVARRLLERGDPTCTGRRRILIASASQKLMEAMRDTVRKGTAKGIAGYLNDVGWAIGGKTGTKIREGQPVTEADGCFAGLIFDRAGKARFTVVTYVRHGGYGGVHAAEISANAARRLALSTW